MSASGPVLGVQVITRLLNVTETGYKHPHHGPSVMARKENLH